MTDHSSIVTGLAAGTGSVALSLLGVNTPTMTIALVACTLGASWAPPSNRWRAAAVFAAAACATAVAAAVLAPLATLWWPWAPEAMWQRALALLVGVTLHPVIAAANAAAPTILKSVTDRLGPKT